VAQPSFQELAAERYVSLVTYRRNGNGVPTPIWVADDGGKLYAVTDGTSAKVKRLKMTDRVRIAACDARGNVRGEWVEGHARRIDDPAVVAKAAAALGYKYGWQFTMLNVFSRLSGRIGRRAYIEISL
jgi:uncharacterized protein